MSTSLLVLWLDGYKASFYISEKGLSKVRYVLDPRYGFKKMAGFFLDFLGFLEMKTLLTNGAYECIDLIMKF